MRGSGCLKSDIARACRGCRDQSEEVSADGGILGAARGGQPGIRSDSPEDGGRAARQGVKLRTRGQRSGWYGLVRLSMQIARKSVLLLLRGYKWALSPM